MTISARAPRTRPLAWLAPFALWAVALAAVSASFPYRPALDDPENLHLARSVAESAQLASDGPFVRVPLWQLLLGGALAIAPERAGVVGLQAGFVALALFAASLQCARAGVSARATLAVLCAVALSPQLVLYARHTPNELALGALALCVGALAPLASARGAFALGAAVGMAAMIKFAGASLALPAAVFAWRARARDGFARALALPLAAGAFAVVAPIALLALAQRGAPLDDTSAFNLGSLEIEEWLAHGSSGARSAAALATFRAAFAADPPAYLAGAAARAADWLLQPSSLELRLWIPEYPALAVELLDGLAFFAVATLAVLGTSRASWPAWILPLALVAACCFPQKTPHSPKVTVLVALLALAARGLASLRPPRAASAGEVSA